MSEAAERIVLVALTRRIALENKRPVGLDELAFDLRDRMGRAAVASSLERLRVDALVFQRGGFWTLRAAASPRNVTQERASRVHLHVQ